MVSMETTILVPKSVIWIALQPIRPSQCCVIPYFHEDLVKRNV